MGQWPIGVFTSIDAGLGVHLSVGQELGIPSVQIHAPHAGTRNAAAAEKFLARCSEAGITITVSSAASKGRATPTFPPQPARSGWSPKPRGPSV